MSSPGRWVWVSLDPAVEIVATINGTEYAIGVVPCGSLGRPFVVAADESTISVLLDQPTPCWLAGTPPSRQSPTAALVKKLVMKPLPVVQKLVRKW